MGKGVVVQGMAGLCSGALQHRTRHSTAGQVAGVRDRAAVHVTEEPPFTGKLQAGVSMALVSLLHAR